ncbi:trypsin-like peptidase domain-containing protein [Candidatus Peregrinibacteria bacterium]|nr:trypsin-like peptidase domain-containing protein [Candidatus Peregrinibacteria bacterium]
MTKKIALIVLFLLSFAPASLAADRDFSTMSPTVRVTSYKKLLTDNVLAYGSGSGTVITPDGLVVTNHHVVFDETDIKPLDAFEVCITFDAKEEPVCTFTASLVALDKDLDIALLKINDLDVFGNSVSGLKTLNPKNSSAPKEQDKIQIMGYPASGGETITLSQGQISGSETNNGFHYFKTDTDFDHGSSGGTVLDANGNYIGIPTYIRSYSENVGYFLDLRDARPWIEHNRTATPTPLAQANTLLTRELVRLSNANQTLTYTQDRPPFAELTLPQGWKFDEINEDNFRASQKNLSNPVSVSVIMTPYQYGIDEGYLTKLNEEIEKLKKSYPDLKKEKTTYAGQSAVKTTFTNYSSRNTIFYIPYGSTLVSVGFSIDLNDVAKQEKAVQPVIDSFRFSRKPVKDPVLSQTLRFEEPPFSITTPDGWKIQKNASKDPSDLLAEAVQKGNYEGSFSIYYGPTPKEDRSLSAKELLDERTKNLGDQKLSYKNDQVVLGGLEGILYIYEYEGNQYQEIKKHLTLTLNDKDNQFFIEYDDLADHFDQNLPAIRSMLDSFDFRGSTAKASSLHAYGSLGSTFTDIQFHPYALAIGALADKGILSADSEGRFRPEAPMGRAEALKLVLDSKSKLETEKNSGKAIDFSTLTSKAKPAFKDLKASSPYAPYARYALEKKFLQGYGDKTFRPVQPITLVEALKLIVSVYEIPLWKGETDPWFKKYMNKGFELGLIPYGLYDPAQKLSRAEMAYLIYTIYQKADNQYSY